MALSLVVLPALSIPVILFTPQHLGFGAVGITLTTVILSLLIGCAANLALQGGAGSRARTAQPSGLVRLVRRLLLFDVLPDN
ncbi:hypothetical protein, partial [Massilia genomosp. 1]|uniref:hypothetical protein n=1 Tax=Massilia genomosp. 1 TaxID=2609280 RepID=UPI001E382E1A